ncbi:genomic island protein [Pseudomonas sp. A-1]|uniref:portal protein n=1 Tax=Pseudomonas sp. A-1 TaxID=1821274 RepID=UPI0010A679D5|nr:genomic island protein [Pseudomonas sp. A-1]THG87097.1 genomic island protein [Pseudomonas sp. A-1]
MSPTAETNRTAYENWQRYEYGRMRGHLDYVKTARINEGMYLGGGLQWSAEDLQALAEAGRPAFEFNQILPKINAALGYQIANRMDITFRPRGGQADQDLASTLSKLTMQIADNTQLHWKESQVFADGLVQQRGYFDVRISYEDSLLGEVHIDALDPLDVIPDPDAKSYDPDSWADVIVTRWLTLDEIEALYGTAKRNEVDQTKPDESDFGEDMGDEARNKFGDNNSGYNDRMGVATQADGERRVRVIDRQFWRMEKAEVLITPTGDIRVVDSLSPARVAAMEAAGAIRQKRRVRRVRWVVSTQCVVLHDDWSPFQHFTVVPYFPFFRRGVTRGLVDNAIGPQQMLNKSLSQMLHIINTTANSGWITWANTLANMTEDELEDRGAETGLHISLKKETPTEKMPRKIQPNQVPTGLDRIIERSAVLLEQATGINDAMVGNTGREVSGIAIQSRQHAAQQQLAVPLDNLARTRNLLARRILDLIQGFYDQPRIVRIVETDARGREMTEELALNYPAANGQILNDLTIGEYDVVIAEVPLQVTFENSQFLQAIELVDKGAPIPWPFVLRYSNLAHKQEIIDALEQQAQQQADPLVEAKVALTQAQTQKTLAESVNKAVESQYSAMQASGVIATTPATAPLADALLRSAGYVDRDAAPIVPEYQANVPTAPVAPDAPTNTNPLTPANPAVGVAAGIETQAIEPV